MDWDANLAAVIKCADANLEQQFRQFADVAGDLTTFSGFASTSSPAAAACDGPARTNDGRGAFATHFQPLDSIFVSDDSSSNNIGTAYFRESMMAANPARFRAAHEDLGDGGRERASTRTSSRQTTSFADDFRNRQARRRSRETASASSRGRGAAPTASTRLDNNDAEQQDNMPDYDEEINCSSGHHRQYPKRGGRGVAYHMYSSPTYDITQMMEQVRLSLKLEVDARAAIAERQLSALLNLCKSSTEETDRLRVEVCANDRQIHTLEQVQAKLRQELTTQKDIAFHLQSMCGKDESWRMQAENQLLELRQMVATIREQGNSLHAASQEKLSRAELLVQFNAAMEPIKAQFQANLQHQAHQIADIARTSSSSSLLLDALTQKVNRGLVDEISELRNELHALKSHVSKMSSLVDIDRSFPKQDPPLISPPEPLLKDPKLEAEKQRRREQQRLELLGDVKSAVLQKLHETIDTRSKEVEKALELRLSCFVAIHDESTTLFQSKVRASCDEREGVLAKTIEQQLRNVQQHVQSVVKEAERTAKDNTEQLKQQVLTATSTLVESAASASQSRQIELLKLVEIEQRERKLAVETLEESCRKSRHSLEDRVHALGHETRSAAAQFADKFDAKLRDLETQSASVNIAGDRELQARIDSLVSTMKAHVETSGERTGGRIREVEDSVARLEQVTSALSAAVIVATAAAKEAATEARVSKAEDAAGSATVTTTSREGSEYLGAIEMMLQKMQLQLQLHTQTQIQTQLAQVPPISLPSPYWAPSPHCIHGSITPSPVTASISVPTLSHPPSTYSGQLLPTPAPVAETEPELGPTTSHVLPPSPVVSVPLPPPPRNPEPQQPQAPIFESAQSHESQTPMPTTANQPIPSLAETSSPSTPASVASRAQPSIEDATANSREVPAVPVSDAPPPVDTAGKIQQTLAATAKGALAEAEMAKMRVENRRKQESELRQQQIQSPLKPPPHAPPSIALVCKQESEHRRQLIQSPVISPQDAPPSLALGSKQESELRRQQIQSPAKPAQDDPSITLVNKLESEQRQQVQSVLKPAPDAPLLAHVGSDSEDGSESVVGAAGSVKKCRHCNADILSQDLFDHELRCDKVLKQCPHCLRRQKVSCMRLVFIARIEALGLTDDIACVSQMAELQDHIENCDCRLVSCPNNCGGKFLQRGIAKHLATRCPNKSPGAAVSDTVEVGREEDDSKVDGSASSRVTPTAIGSAVSPRSVTTAAMSILSAQQPIAAKSASTATPTISGLTALLQAPKPTTLTADTATAECKFCDEEFPAAEIDAHEDKCVCPSVLLYSSHDSALCVP